MNTRDRFRTLLRMTGVATAAAMFAAATPHAAPAETHPSARERLTLEQNKAVARRWSDELWNRGDLAVADEIVAADYVRHDPGDPFPARGPAGVKQLVGMLRGMLPDLAIRIEAIVAEGDMVVTHYTSTATDTRGYMGMPATGRAIRTSAMQMFRIVDGKIVESWAVRDDLGVLRQLGHVAAPSMAATR